MRCTIAASLQMLDEPYFYPDVVKSNERACICRLSCCIILLYEQNPFLSIVYNKGSIK